MQSFLFQTLLGLWIQAKQKFSLPMETLEGGLSGDEGVTEMVESKLGTRLWTHQDRLDNEVFSLYFSNANGLDIVNVFIASMYYI